MYGLGGPGLESRKGQKIFLSSPPPKKRQDQLWGPTTLLFNRSRDSFPDGERPGRKVNS